MRRGKSRRHVPVFRKVDKPPRFSREIFERKGTILRDLLFESIFKTSWTKNRESLYYSRVLKSFYHTKGNTMADKTTDAYGTVIQKYLSLSEISKRWAVSPVFVRRMAKSGELPAVRLGRILRVKISDLEQYEKKKADEFKQNELPSPL